MANEIFLALVNAPLARILLTALGLSALASLPSLVLSVLAGEFLPAKAGRALARGLRSLAALPLLALGFLAFSSLQTNDQGIFAPPFFLFGATFLVPRISQGIMDALEAVPAAIRRAGFALGASRLSLTVELVIPAARHKIVRAILGGFSAAIAETGLILMLAYREISLLPLVLSALIPAFFSVQRQRKAS